MNNAPPIATPRDIAITMGGTWTCEPSVLISAVRHRVDLIEPDLRDFLFVPELFAKLHGPKAREALLASTEAVRKGAAGIISTSQPRNLDPGFPCLIVADPALALLKFAEKQRADSIAKFVAVTGSVGKTTTKNMVHHLASALGPAHRSIANYNKGIESISLTLSNLSRAHAYSTAEFNEIRYLKEQTRLYRPDIAVITNVLWEHIDVVERQGYGGDKAIPRLAYLAASVVREMPDGGVCVLNADEQNFEVLAKEIARSGNVQLRSFGHDPSCDVQIAAMHCGIHGSEVEIRVDGKTFAYELTLPGRHMAVNSVAAATAAYYASMDLGRVLPTLASFQPEQRRGVRTVVPWKDGEIVFRDESFSSSVPSLRSSFAQLEMEQPTGHGRRIAVLGQVGDLGKTMPSAMTALAQEADALTIDRYYTVGSDIRIFNEALADRDRVVPHFQTVEQLKVRLQSELISGDVILVKGSDDPYREFSLNGFVEKLRSGGATADIGQSVLGSRRRVIIVGDTYFGEFYQRKRAGAALINYMDVFGYDYFGANLCPLLTGADFTVVNLECALTTMPTSPLVGKKDFVLAGNPDKTISALKALNVGGVLLGNNHAMDYLSEGLSDTIEHLKQADIDFAGAGAGKEDAQKPILRTIDVDGIPFKLAILSGYQFRESYDDMGFYSGTNSLGVNNINLTRLRDQISSLRQAGYYVIGSPHWGSNYCLRSHDQTYYAQRMVNLGADLILGHGPHVMNEIQNVDGVWVAYSLGNFIFNSEGNYSKSNIPPYSLIAEIDLVRDGNAIEGRLHLYPIVCCNQITQFQPQFVTERQFDQVTNFLTSAQYLDFDCRNGMTFEQIDGRFCITVKLF